MKSTKVLHVVEIEKEAFYFNNLIDFSDRSKVDFTFVTLYGESEFTESIKKRGCQVYALNARRKYQLPRAAYQIWHILRTEAPEIVHAHGFNPTCIALNLAKFQRRKTALTRHHSDAIHLLPSKLKRSFYLKLEHRNNQLADHIIAPSTMVRDCVVDWEGTPSTKVSVIPYGQDHERFDQVTSEMIRKTRRELGMDNQLSLVCVSRLFNRKGHEYLFQALASLKKNGLPTRLYLAGEGDYKERLLQIAEDLEIQGNIEFLGWRSDVLALIGSADIIVHPSLEDALSQSLIESLMMGRPIIATDISGATDTLDGGKYGKLVKPGDAESLRLALIDVIENLEVAVAKAKKGRDYLLDYMSAARVAKEYMKIYQALLTER